MINQQKEIKQELFSQCNSCVVKEWCRLRSGEVSLPSTYPFGDFCVGNDKLERSLSLANVPKEYRNANSYHYVKDEDNAAYAELILATMENAVNFVKKGKNIAFIHPNKGTGKTWSAVGIMNQFIYKTCRDDSWFDYENPVALYVKFGTWANQLRRIYNTKDENFANQVHRLTEQMREVPLLVLDDIGSGRITEYIRDITYDVIDYRKEEMKSTIYTSNFPDTMLQREDMLGEMIVSRMFYNTYVVQLGGKDRRETLQP